MTTRTRSIRRARSDGHLKSLKSQKKLQKKIEYLEHHVKRFNKAFQELFEKFGDWSDEEGFNKYPYLELGENFVTSNVLDEKIVRNNIRQLAIRVQRDIDKKNKTKKNIEKFKGFANAVMTATRRKKQPAKLILKEPIKPGTLLTDAGKRTIISLKKSQKTT
tara:strand:- start:132 stop:617 length:486 start_codon:yes stop_codon:yes gene_type:complete